MSSINLNVKETSQVLSRSFLQNVVTAKIFNSGLCRLMRVVKKTYQIPQFNSVESHLDLELCAHVRPQ